MLPCCLVLVTDILQPKLQRVGYSGRSKGGDTLGAPSPYGPKFFKFHAVFWENLTNLYAGAPLLHGWHTLLRGILDPPLGYTNLVCWHVIKLHILLTRYKSVKIPSQWLLHIIMLQLLKKHVLQRYAESCKSCSSTVRLKRALQGYGIVTL